MSNCILYHDNSCESGRALKEALRIGGGTQDPGTVDKLLRWGNRMQIARKPHHVLNERGAMDIASNKARSFQFMQENGIPCPPLKTRFEGKLLYGRHPSHLHGQGLFIIMCEKDMERARQLGCNHFVEAIPCDREMRFHVFRNEIIFCYERVVGRDTKYLHVRNDWSEIHVESPPRDGSEIAIDCVEKMGLDFAALDMVKSTSGRWYVLEANTSPGLVNSDGSHKPSFRAYERKFREWLEE